MVVDTSALKSGDILGATGLKGINIGGIGNVLILIILFVVLIASLCGLVIYIIYRKSFSQKIVIFSLIGNKPTLKMIDKAKIVRMGMAGDTLFYLKKLKKMIAPPTIQMGKKTWWYWQREDGELINFSLADLNEEMRKAGAYFVDIDMRMQRLGIEKNLRDRFQKESFWKKHAGTIMGVIFIVLVTVSLVVLFAKLVDVADALTETASAVKEMALAVEGTEGERPSGLTPALIIPLLLIKFTKLKRRKK